ncbi:type IV pilus modification protein PilV [Thiothrix subterranea]|uniref:Type IV pilus modification protein PilV n=1 Tax=Thiothrix subterranea TaxID=2735563 RepID=A0AA51MQH4_9GAMM|nr:type IV pilus modification protein PilV [Thiothrix subterranea]MDQ5767335.1 type IV pilus modification protein PilV [Thiothrix subterranea]WML88804.1 type IV pilus modification protein PilV [Thiothrix subterranea]
MPIRLASRRQQSGLSLIEVLIATVVLSTGLLGLAGLQIAGMKTTHNSYQMQQATWIVHELLEKMRANRTEVFRMSSDSTPVPQSGYLLANLTNAATYCANTSLAKNCAVDTDCTNAQLATYDLHQTLCGYGSSTGISNVLIGGQLQVTCPTGNCSNGVTVTLQWDERNATRQADFDGGTDGIETFTINLNAVL